MAGGRAWTDEEDPRVLACERTFEAYARLGRKIGRSAMAVSTRRYDLSTPSRHHRFWSPDEDAILREHHRAIVEVETRLGRPYGMILARARKLAKRERG